MPSLESAADDYGGFSLNDERIVVIHLLLYGMDLESPSPKDARLWEEHYGIDKKPNHVVLVGDPRMQSSQTYQMIPGLQLIDRDFVLRFDSAGRRATHDMWTDLLPGVSRVLSES